MIVQMYPIMEETEMKTKKTRRGKRSGRRVRRSELEKDEEQHPLNDQQNQKNFKCARSRYSPKAPHNSTQFIMNDQANDQMCSPNSRLLGHSMTDEISFYSDGINEVVNRSPFCSSETESDIDPSDTFYSDYADIDFNGLSADSSSYMVNDFESFYNQMRADKLSELSRDELVKETLKMEERVSTLEQNVQKTRRSSCVHNSKAVKYTLSEKRPEAQTVIPSLLKELKSLRNENHILRSRHKSLPHS